MADINEGGVRDSVVTEDSVNIRDSMGYPQSEVPESIVSYAATEDVVDPQNDEGTVSKGGYAIDNDQPTPWYKRKRFWAICAAFTLVLLAILIPIIILVIFPAVAQSSINKSKIQFSALQINPPMDQDHFVMSVYGNVTNGGSFNAKITFPQNVDIQYGGTVVATTRFPSLDVKHGKATFQSIGNVTIVNPAGFSDFAKDTLTKESLKIKLVGKADLTSVGMTKKNLKVDKEVEIIGSNGFKNGVVTKNIDLAENPDQPGSINVRIDASIDNPSPVGVYTGDTGFAISYLGVELFNANVSNFNLTTGENNIQMNGVATKMKQEDGYAVGSFIASYLNGTKVGTDAKGIYSIVDGHHIKWIENALESLTISAPFDHDAVQTLSNIDLGNVTFDFVGGSAYAPLMTAPLVTSDLKLPWKVHVNLVEAKASMSMLYGGLEIAALEQSEYGPANNTDSKAFLSVANTPLIVKNKAVFNAMMKAVTQAKVLNVDVAGSVDTKAKIAIFDEPIDIQGITFKTTTKLVGLQGLNAQPTVISTLTVVGGQADGLILQANATMFNPSPNHIKMGDVNFALTYQDAAVGTLQLPNFELVPGVNSISSLAKVNPNTEPKAKEVLLGYLSGQQMPITFAGTEQSTNIDSLKDALATIKVQTTTPKFNETLIKGASLTIPENIGETGEAASNVQVFNPFDVEYEILGMTANVNAGPILVGKIDIPQLPAGAAIGVAAKGTARAENLPIKLNLDPVQMFTLLRTSALKNGLNVKPLDALLTLGGINVPGADKVQPDPAIFDGFRLDEFVKNSMGKMLVDIDMEATVKIGDFQFVLPYQQKNVVATTDNSIVRLIPILGGPIVEGMVAKSQLTIDKTFIANPTDDGFHATLNGAIQNTGPLPAKISFPNGAQVQDGETVLGTMQMSDVQAANNKAILDVHGDFKIANADALTQFTKNLLLNEAAAWTIKASLTVDALGVAFPNIPFAQKAELTGASGFKGQAKIKSFDLPSESQQGGLVTVIDFSLHNPSSVGVEVGKLQLAVIAEDIQIGFVESDGLSIQAKEPTDAKLTGRIFRQTTPKGLALLSKLFSAFIAGVDVPMTSQCLGAIPPSGSAKWLSEALKVVTLEVVLPADPSKGNVIQGITIDQMTIDATPDTAYGPVTSANITANIKPPFSFKLDIVQLEEAITIINNGAPMAKLQTPLLDARTDFDKRIVVSSYGHLSLNVIDSQQINFNGFVKDLTLASEKGFGLQGVVSKSVTDTPVGQVVIEGIKINVKSDLKGMQGFHAKPVPINDVDVVAGGPTSLTISLKTNLFNPSALTVSLGTVSLNFVASKTVLGQVTLKDFTVVPGDNALSPKTVLEPPLESAPIALALLGKFVGGADQQVQIVGSRDSTPIVSFKDALSGISIDTTLHGLKKNMVQGVSLEILDSTLKDGIANGGFTVANPFTAPVTIFSIQSAVTYAGLPIAKIDTTLTKPMVCHGKSTTTGTDIPVKMNLDPATLTKAIKIAAKRAGIDLPFDMPGMDPGSLRKRDNPDKKPDLPTLILEVLNSMELDIDFSGSVAIDQFIPPAPLSFPQKNVTNHMDKSALKLIGLIGAPIVAENMAASKLGVDTTAITKLRANEFAMEMKGSITDAGKIPATIAFTKGLNVNFNGKLLGTFDMKPVEVDENGDGTIDQNTEFTIKDVQAFTEFSGFMLSQPKFTWDIAADDVEVTAIGAKFEGQKLRKNVTLKGFDGLKDVNITAFDIMGPAKGGKTGLTVACLTDITNPSSVGVELGDMTLGLSLFGFDVGTGSGKGVTLPAGKTTSVGLDVQLVPDKSMLPLVGTLFTSFLAGDRIDFTATGKDVNPPGSDDKVPWLQIPFQHLKLDIPLLPPKFKLVKSMAVVVSEQTFLSGYATSSFVMDNPLSADFSLKNVKGRDVLNKNELGTVDYTFPKPFTVKGKGEATATDIPILITGNISDLLPLFKKAKSNTITIPTDVELKELSTVIGGLEGDGVSYNQEGIPTTITVPDSLIPYMGGIKGSIGKDGKGAPLPKNAESDERESAKKPKGKASDEDSAPPAKHL